jgi:hypothetical protein
MCEKITKYSKGDDTSLVTHMVTVLKAAQAIAVTKLPPCEAKHVWGN